MSGTVHTDWYQLEEEEVTYVINHGYGKDQASKCLKMLFVPINILDMA